MRVLLQMASVNMCFHAQITYTGISTLEKLAQYETGEFLDE
jgi:hypothetical protein